MISSQNIDFSNRKLTQDSSLVDKQFTCRWSPRRFKKQDISPEIQTSLFEAARWSPSSYNEQPWRILASTCEEEFNTFLSVLFDFNQAWAKNASILGIIAAEKKYAENGKDNYCAEFDCGFAWATLTFQANKHGLYTHGMSGVHYEKVSEVFSLPETIKPLMAFAIGYIDLEGQLPEGFPPDVPSDRKILSDIYFPGGKSVT